MMPEEVPVGDGLEITPELGVGAEQDAASAGAQEEEQQTDQVVPESYDLPPLGRPAKKYRLKAHVVRKRVATRLLAGLPGLAQRGEWVACDIVLQSLLILHAQDTDTVEPLMVKGTSKLLGIVRQATSAGRPAAPALARALEALLPCVRASESASDQVAESEVIRLLLQLVRQPDSPPAARLHAAEVLAVLASSPQLVYRDVLQGAGATEAVLAALMQAGCLVDTSLVYELLWTLLGLCSDDSAYLEMMAEQGTLQVMSALFALLQPHLARPELRPLAAQMLRIIHLLVQDNDVAKERCRKLGLLRRLADQLRLDLAAAAEPGQPLAAGAAAAALGDASRRPLGAMGSGSLHYHSPHHHHLHHLTARSGATPPGSPRSSGGGDGHTPAPRHHHHHFSSLAALAIPEGEELALVQEAGRAGLPGCTEEGEDTDSEGEVEGLMEEREAFGAERAASVAGQPDGALALMHRGPSPVQRAAAGALLRAALGGGAGAELLAAGLLLSELGPPRQPPVALGRARLSLSVEVAGLTKAVLVDSPDNQEAAAAAQLVPSLVKLLHVRSAELGAEAAEAIAQLGALRAKLLAAGALEGLVHFVHECMVRIHAAELAWLREAPAAAAASSGSQRRGSGASKGGGGGWWRGWGSRSAAAAELSVETTQVPDGVRSSGSGGLLGRQRATEFQSHRHCLVCAVEPGRLCPYRPLSAAVKALSRLLGPEPEVQAAFVRAGGVPELVSAMAPAVAQGHWRLLASLVSLASVALQGCPQAQDELRFASGIDLLAHALAWLVQPGVSDVLQLRPALLRVLTLAVEGNSAAKLALREQGGFTPLIQLLDHMAKPDAKGAAQAQAQVQGVEDAEQLDGAAIELLTACLPGSPGNQEALHRLGATDVLLLLLKAPATSTDITLGALRALGLLADGQPACQTVVTAAGGLATVIGILAESSVPTTQQVCLEALVRLLRGNKAGQAQALELAAIPLAVRLMREAASYAVAAGAADLLALLANGGTAAQGEAASEGGLAALMEWLEPYAGGSSVSPAALKLMSLSLSSTAAAAEPAAMSAAAACVACLHTLGCVVADNTFTKNMARQLGAFSTLGAILRRNSGALSASMAAVGAGAGGSLAPAQRDAALQLQVLTGAVLAVADLAHSNHANQDALAAGGLVDALAELLSRAVGGSSSGASSQGQGQASLEGVARWRGLVAALCRALASAGEFHAANKALIRESGAMGSLAALVLLAAEAPDLSCLTRLRLGSALAGACAAMATLAADCDESQRVLLEAGPDLLPALFRLAGAEEPALAAAAARALEFLAIRNDNQDDADDRSEFESETITALVRLLSRSGNATAVGAAAAGAPPPSAAAVREASTLLALVVSLSDLDNTSNSASAGVAAGTGSAEAGGGTGGAPAAGAPAAAQRSTLGGLPSAAEGAAAGSGPGSMADGALRPASLPTLITDHSKGLAMLRAWSGPTEASEAVWQELVGRSAPAFQPVAAAVSDGPWKAFKVQVAWMLFLLSAKLPANREQISRLQRTSIAPLAQQLENAEKFAATAAAEAEEEEAAAPAAPSGATPAAQARRNGSLPVSTSADAGSQEGPTSPLAPQPVARGAASTSSTSSDAASGRVGTLANAGSAGLPPLPGSSSLKTPLPAAAGELGGLQGGRQGSLVAGGSDAEDEWSMLQQEVLFLSAALPSGGGAAGSAQQPPAPA